MRHTSAPPLPHPSTARVRRDPFASDEYLPNTTVTYSALPCTYYGVRNGRSSVISVGRRAAHARPAADRLGPRITPLCHPPHAQTAGGQPQRPPHVWHRGSEGAGRLQAADRRHLAASRERHVQGPTPTPAAAPQPATAQPSAPSTQPPAAPPQPSAASKTAAAAPPPKALSPPASRAAKPAATAAIPAEVRAWITEGARARPHMG